MAAQTISPAVSTTSYLLSRANFVATHAIFLYSVQFFFNDPLGLLAKVGLTTVDQPETDGTCTSFSSANFLHGAGLMTAWLVQHCGMARMKFKKLTGLHESPLERPLFGLAANFTWFATLYFWKPINTCASFNVFDANALLLAPAAALIVAGSALIVALLWMLPDHVFGTNHYKGATATTGNEDAEIIYDFPYGMVRHPASAGFVWLYIGVALMAGLAINHAFLAAAWIGFIFTGTVFEEKGLHREFGEKYATYASKVNKFFPKLSYFLPSKAAKVA